MKKFTKTEADACAEAARSAIDEINGLKPLGISELPTKNTALVIVDIINGFIREGALSSPVIADIIPSVKRLMEYFKANYMPILALADCHKPGCAEFADFPAHCLDKTAESEIVDELKETGGYFLMKKNSTNGFHEMEFVRGITQNPQLTRFIITGDCTDICVLQLALSLKTWFNAQNRSSDIIIPLDCVETFDAPGHSGSFMNIAAYKIMAVSGIRFVSSVET